MPRSISKLALAGAAMGALCSAGAASAQEQARTQGAELPDYYDYYEVGYDTNYDDDWFFDYFQYELQSYHPQYDYYTDYDYQQHVFDWEERGLFDAGATHSGPQRATPGLQPYQMQPGREL